jgi:hypothetical protein
VGPGVVAALASDDGAVTSVAVLKGLGLLFKHFLFCVIISMKETFKNIFSWGRKAHLEGLIDVECKVFVTPLTLVKSSDSRTP